MSLSASERQAILVKLFSDYMNGELTQGQLLKKLRKDLLGINQTEYAKKVNVSRKTLSDIELDKGNTAQPVLAKVFRPFGLKPGVQLIHQHVVDELFAIEAGSERSHRH